MNHSQVEPHLSKYLHSVGVKKGLPIGGNFELTPRCNFNCPMCYVHLNKDEIGGRRRELTTQEWIDLARQACDRGMVFALLTGGEPFLRKDFFEIYNAMKAMGILISINTNGSLLSGSVLTQLLENPPFRMNISLYGGSRETYLNMCGVDAFDAVLNNIRRLKEVGIDVRINLSITPYNKDDIDDIYKIAKEMNLQVKATSYMYPPVRINEDADNCTERLSFQEAARCQVHWDKLRFTEEEFDLRAVNMKKMIVIDEEECSLESEWGVRCRAGRSSFWITWDGKMLPCGMMPWPIAYPMETGFDVAWEQIRKETNAIKLPEECSICKKKDICTVCAATCVTETGSFQKVPRYVCNMVEESMRYRWELYQGQECYKKR